MANTFYEPGEQRAAKVNALFARIASRYDLMNDLQSFGLHRLWKRRVLSLARPRPGESALDLCCGTGDLAFALALQGATVAGVDFSAEMLAVAERRNKSRPPRPKSEAAPRFLQGDAQALAFPDDSFDIVTVGYGLRNLADWKLGLREMARTAKPGGRLLVLDFGKPNNRLWRALYFSYLKLFVPVLGFLFCGSSSAYAYILESLRNYPAQEGVADEMRAMGLRSVRVVNLLGGIMSINYAEKSSLREVEPLNR